MAKVIWKQTFTADDGLPLSNADIYVYKAGTTRAARVWDADNNLFDTAPQLNTDTSGQVTLKLDDSDYPTGQLFDIECHPGTCQSTEETIYLKSLMIFQDTQGGRSFKQVFVQATIPDIEDNLVREGDLWIETDDNNEWHVAEVSGGSLAWVSRRDGSIATPNWSDVVDDGGKPDDNATVGAKSGTNLVDESDAPLGDSDIVTSQGTASDVEVGAGKAVAESGADVTNNNTANNTEYVNGSTQQSGSGNELDFYDDVRIYSGGDIKFFSGTPGTYVGSINNSSLGSLGGIYISSSNNYDVIMDSDDHIRISASGNINIVATSGINITGDLVPTVDDLYDLGSSTYAWSNLNVEDITNPNGTLDLSANTNIRLLDTCYSYSIIPNTSGYDIGSSGTRFDRGYFNDLYAGSSGSPITIYLWDTNTSAFYPYDAYITA